jgi:hypothetical protein
VEPVKAVIKITVTRDLSFFFMVIEIYLKSAAKIIE